MALPLRINFFVENYVAGGLERFYFDLINGLPIDGFDVTLLANPLEGLAERLGLFLKRPVNWVPYKNVTATTLDYRVFHAHDRRRLNRFIQAGRLIARFPLHVASRIRLRGLFERHPGDIMHIINGGYPGAQGCITAARAAQLAGFRRILMSVQSSPYPRKSRLDVLLDRQLLRAVDCLVPNSLAAGQALISLRGFPKSKISPIQTGTPPPPYSSGVGVRLRSELGLPADSILIGTVAALELLKGHLVLLEALCTIQMEFPRAHLIFLGDGIARSHIDSYIQAHHLKGRVSLLGHRDDARLLTNAFDIVVLPSLYEGLPISILEAMALAKPIVATNVGGIPEEIDHEVSGLLFPPRDSRALADALKKLLHFPTEAARMGEAAQKKYYSRFTAQHMVESFLGLYSQTESHPSSHEPATHQCP
jgi:glycosyltransferase involved in cell wall biosynthesis